MSSNEEMMRRAGGAAAILTKVEMDIVCSTEKLVNLNVLMMNVAARESDLEASVLVKEAIPDEKVLEFSLLCDFFDLEVTELGSFFDSLRKEIVVVREIILATSSKHIEQGLMSFEEKLRDCEEQLEDLKVQSADLQKSNYASDTYISRSNLYLENEVHMQTGEQQRHVLRLLEKSLARELDLDAKLNEARQNEEELKWMLLSSTQEASYLEILIHDMASKASSAEYLAESNVKLNEEVSSLWNKLEKSIHEIDEIKMESAKNIGMRAEVITSLVMELTMERDRLHEQLHSLAKENKLLVARLQTTNKGQTDAVDSISNKRYHIERVRIINARTPTINYVVLAAFALIMISLVAYSLQNLIFFDGGVRC